MRVVDAYREEIGFLCFPRFTGTEGRGYGKLKLLLLESYHTKESYTAAQDTG